MQRDVYCSVLYTFLSADKIVFAYCLQRKKPDLPPRPDQEGAPVDLHLLFVFCLLIPWSAIPSCLYPSVHRPFPLSPRFVPCIQSSPFCLLHVPLLFWSNGTLTFTEPTMGSPMEEIFLKFLLHFIRHQECNNTFHFNSNNGK